MTHDLHGVDDSDESANLTKRALMRDGFVYRVRWIVLIILGVSGVGGVLACFVTGWREYLLAGLMGVCAVCFVAIWERRRARRHLPQVLQNAERCMHCGYPVVTTISRGICPECGTEIGSQTLSQNEGEEKVSGRLF